MVSIFEASAYAETAKARRAPTDERDGDLERGDAVHEGHAGVGAGGKNVRDAVLAGALGEGNVEDVVVHVARVLFGEATKAARGVLRKVRIRCG
jgi:hypothetical protein